MPSAGRSSLGTADEPGQDWQCSGRRSLRGCQNGTNHRSGRRLPVGCDAVGEADPSPKRERGILAQKPLMRQPARLRSGLCLVAWPTSSGGGGVDDQAVQRAPHRLPHVQGARATRPIRASSASAGSSWAGQYSRLPARSRSGLGSGFSDRGDPRVCHGLPKPVWCPPIYGSMVSPDLFKVNE
jgi:hypothetical protein